MGAYIFTGCLNYYTMHFSRKLSYNNAATNSSSESLLLPEINDNETAFWHQDHMNNIPSPAGQARVVMCLKMLDSTIVAAWWL